MEIAPISTSKSFLISALKEIFYIVSSLRVSVFLTFNSLKFSDSSHHHHCHGNIVRRGFNHAEIILKTDEILQ